MNAQNEISRLLSLVYVLLCFANGLHIGLSVRVTVEVTFGSCLACLAFVLIVWLMFGLFGMCFDCLAHVWPVWLSFGLLAWRMSLSLFLVGLG